MSAATNAAMHIVDTNSQGDDVVGDEMNLGDIPDLSGIEDGQPEPFINGWYEGTILEQHAFTDRNGNDRVFESNDTPAQKSGRNIRLQVAIKRRADGRSMTASTIVNYQPEDLTQEAVRAVMAQKEKVTAGEEWGSLFRAFMTLNRLGKLQKIGGVRQLQRNGDGGLDLTPLYGKKAYFKLKDDDRNPQYKTIADFRESKPNQLL